MKKDNSWKKYIGREERYSRRKYYWYIQNVREKNLYIQNVNFSNSAIAILDLSLLLLINLSLLTFFANFFFLLDCSFCSYRSSKQIAMSIVVALSRSQRRLRKVICYFWQNRVITIPNIAIVRRVLTIQRAIYVQE